MCKIEMNRDNREKPFNILICEERCLLKEEKPVNSGMEIKGSKMIDSGSYNGGYKESSVEDENSYGFAKKSYENVKQGHNYRTLAA